MTIKKFAFEVQTRLIKAHGIDLKRSHVHEVLAALLGFASYASLNSRAALGQRSRYSPSAPRDIAAAASRALDLGYAPPSPPIIAALVAEAAEAERLCVVPLRYLLADLGIETDSEEWDELEDHVSDSDSFEDEDRSARDESAMPSIDLDSSVLRESLERMADAGSASAHLALAQLDEGLDELEESGINDGRYWFEQQQAGRALTGVELEWAEDFRRKGEARSSREEHLRRAAALGSAEAALILAEEDPTDETFELAARVAGDRYADRLGELALSCGRRDDARNWFRVAAQGGDTDAMKTLASGLESNLKSAWTWVHLARLLDVDVMAYHAVGEDGYELSPDADDAVPIYAAGGFELDPLSRHDDEAAKHRARELYEAIVS
ncbi:MAG: hypothetical protein QM722_05180 [Piscinibacter sp.]